MLGMLIVLLATVGVVSRESVRITFTYTALNVLDVFVADVQNAYLQAPTSEKHYIICGDEFGIKHRGKVARLLGVCTSIC